jgi:hypothetical protein
MIEGSGSRARSGSGSIPLISGSGSGRPKNTWIRWIWIRIRNTAGILYLSSPSENKHFQEPIHIAKIIMVSKNKVSVFYLSEEKNTCILAPPPPPPHHNWECRYTDPDPVAAILRKTKFLTLISTPNIVETA